MLKLCTPEEFVAKSNEIIHPPFDLGYHSISNIYRKNAKLELEAENEGLSNALELASAICSMMLSPSSVNEPFQPYIQFEGKRSAIADDFSSEQLEFIANVYPDMDEPLVKARFADLLWLRVNPKKVKHVHAAIQHYLMLPIDPETWHSDIGSCWERCIRLSRTIRDIDSIVKIENQLLAALDQEYADSPFMHLWIAELIESNRLCSEQYELVAESVFGKGKLTQDKHGYRQAREYLFLAEKMFKSLGNESRWLDCLVLSAEYWELEGDSRCGNGSTSQMAANSFYESALQAYRKIPVSKRYETGVAEKLVSIRSKISGSGFGSLGEMGVIQSEGVDISELVEGARKHVGGKESLELSLLFFTGFSASTYQDLRNRTIEQIQQFPLSNLFASAHMASDGRVIAKTPSLDLHGESEDNDLAIINKTIQSFHLDMQLMVQGQIIPALNQILSEFRVTKGYLKRICYQSPIVPEEREYLMSSALWSGFEHDFGNGIHLLAPQVEHVVRTILKSKGIHTSNIDQAGIENENGLTTLLNHERAKEVLGEDLWFELKAVFTESVGSNLRNEVAHGLLSDHSSNSTASVYAWWMVLRLVVRSLYEPSCELG